MNLLDIVLETDRLRLVPIEIKHRREIFEAFTETVARYTWPQPTGDITHTDTFINEARDLMAAGRELQLVVRDMKTDEFLGCAGLHHIDTHYPEPGLWLKEGAWGHGYGTEIIAALKMYADKHLEYEYMQYPVASANKASRAIPEKLGGVLVPKPRIVFNMNGAPIMEVMYIIYPQEE